MKKNNLKKMVQMPVEIQKIAEDGLMKNMADF
jgi:hypothetical protein